MDLMGLRSRSVSLLLLLNALGAAQSARFTPADLNSWHEISDPQITGDGTQVAWVETTANRARIWISARDGTGRRLLSHEECNESGPRWSADAGWIAFLSNCTGSPGLFVRRPNAEGMRQIGAPGARPLAFAWSPDGRTLAFTAQALEPLPDIGWAPIVLRPQLRTQHVRLFLAPVAGGEAHQVPLGDLEPIGEPAWMPDGRSLLLSLAAPFDPEHPLEGPEIYSLRIDGFTLRRLTHHPGPDTDPTPSPDGSRIAWISREPAAQSYVTAKLWVAGPDGSRARVLAGALDRDVMRPQWSSDSRTVYFLAEDHGASHIYAARNDGSVRQVTSARERLHGFALADDGTAVAVRSPEEVVTFPVDRAGQPVAVATPNADLLAGHQRGEVERIAYRSGEREIEGWITMPPGFDASKKYPLAIDFDDAPRHMCGGEFRLRTQILAAAGFVVLCVNPRGTPGYGEAFGNVIRTGFPGDTFDDVLAGVDAVARRPYIDASRAGMVGGLLAAWAIGHTDRFHAAVARRPITDFALDAATSPDGVYRAAAWMGAMPWADPDQYVKHSPLYSAGGFRTPTLVIAGEHDAAADELCFALRMRRSECVRIHAADAVSELEATIGWLKR
jgi:dipeptidyl aminopeptidase/acylaminoacyl peptidase